MATTAKRLTNTSQKPTKSKLGLKEIEDVLEGLLQTFQVPTKVRVQKVENRPFETFREIDAKEISRCGTFLVLSLCCLVLPCIVWSCLVFSCVI
jgi:hypothetical protein